MYNQDRTVLISGASRGIGKCIAKQILKDGHNISIGLRDKEKFKKYNGVRFAQY